MRTTEMTRAFTWFPLACATDALDEDGGFCILPAFFMGFVDLLALFGRVPLFFVGGYNV